MLTIRRPLSIAAIAAMMLVMAVALHIADAAEPASLSARIDGRLWIAGRISAATFRFGPRPALNISAQREGPPSSKLSFNLVLPAEDDYVHEFELARPAARLSHATFLFNVMTPEAPELSFAFASGRLVIESYDAERQTVSGHFAGRASNLAGTRSIDISDGRFTNISVLAGP